MVGITRSLSAPNLSGGNSSIRNESFLTESESDAPWKTYSSVSRASQCPMLVNVSTSFEFQGWNLHRSPIIFRSYVLLLVFVQVTLGSLQWMAATYRWRPHFSHAERSLYVVLLLMSWTNLTTTFIGFRRLQYSFPLNWIIFFSVFESLTLLVMCMRIIELDLTWPFMLFGIALLLVYSVLGLWVPKSLSANLWVIILASIVVILTSAAALAVDLQMRYYVPLSFCLVVFGPWAMYNSQRLFLPGMRTGYLPHQYLEAAGRMYANYAVTVLGITFFYHLSAQVLDPE